MLGNTRIWRRLEERGEKVLSWEDLLVPGSGEGFSSCTGVLVPLRQRAGLPPQRAGRLPQLLLQDDLPQVGLDLSRTQAHTEPLSGAELFQSTPIYFIHE